MSVRFGIVGCGAIHGTHADGILATPGAELAGFYDLVPERSERASARYGGRAAGSLPELLEHVDAVCICVPSGDHHTVGIEVAQAKKHVLTEKPIDVTVDQATALIDACDEAGVVLGVISQHRMAPDIQRVRDAAQSGDLGRLISADATIKWYRSQAYYDSGDWRGTWKLDGGGCLMNQGVHYIDMIQWIMGDAVAVRALTRTVAHTGIEVEDLAYAIVEYANGGLGLIQGSTSCYPGFAERLEIHGTHGSAIIEADALKFWDVLAADDEPGLYGKGVMSQPAPNQSRFAAEPGPPPAWGDLHAAQIDDFTRAIEEGRPPAITGRDALKPLQIILAIYESARRNGERVPVG